MDTAIPAGTFRVLIVDEDEIDLHLTQQVVTRSALGEVLLSSDTAHVADLIVRHRPDIVVLALADDTEGDPLGELLAARTRTFLPVIVLVPQADRDLHRTALAAGAHEVLAKPLHFAALNDRIRTLLHTRTQFSELSRRASALDTQLRALHHQHRVVVGDLAHLRKDDAVTRADLDAALKWKEALQNEFDHTRQQATTLQAQLDQSEQHNATLQAQVEDCEQQIGALNLRMGGAAPNEDRDAALRREKAARIQRAIDEDEISMVYQPIVSIVTGRTVGVEALARFSGLPARPPDEWFAEAAEADMAVPLEMAAVNAALAECADLPDDVFLAVNASPQLLKSPALLGALANAGGRKIVVEMTEHEDVGDHQLLSDAAKAVRALGVRVAVDDAGSGFASLEHIVQMSPDIVKFDRRLIGGLDCDPIRHALVAALVRFGTEIGVIVVAEGVENAEEMAVLRELGVDFVQGYHLARPSELATALSDEHGRDLVADERVGSSPAGV